MAGKKIASKKKADADGPQSKTARASMARKGKQEGFIPAAPENMDRIISLAGGEFLYLLDPRDGKTHHLQTGSHRYYNVVAEIMTTNHGPHIEAELVRKGFLIPVPEVVGD